MEGKNPILGRSIIEYRDQFPRPFVPAEETTKFDIELLKSRRPRSDRRLIF